MVFLVYVIIISENKINKPLHRNGHVPNITHVGGSRSIMTVYEATMQVPRAS
jgi:hypothetical protein